MKRDVLIYDRGTNEKQAALLEWAQHLPGLHLIENPDYHRLQLEKWVYDRRDALGHLVMDVGQSRGRRWFGDGYFTLGLYDCDVIGDILNIPLQDGKLDGAIMTEVLEHCGDPFGAIAEVRRVLKPGGMLFVTSPFIWSWHGRRGFYDDFWRFTRQGWELLLKGFSKVEIKPTEWTDEGEIFWDMLRRWECFGYEHNTEGASGYLCEARK